MLSGYRGRLTSVTNSKTELSKYLVWGWDRTRKVRERERKRERGRKRQGCQSAKQKLWKNCVED